MIHPSPYIFCPHCKSDLKSFTDGELLRSQCPSCDWIYYRNPIVGVAVVLLDADRILLGERSDGGWCIPCGHVEWDEGVEEAARREFLEETGLEVTLHGVLAVQSNFHNPAQHTVGIWYLGVKVRGALLPGGDLVHVRYFPIDNLPPLKFPTDRKMFEKILSVKDLI